jgi:hypothetical protein
MPAFVLVDGPLLAGGDVVVSLYRRLTANRLKPR